MVSPLTEWSSPVQKGPRLSREPLACPERPSAIQGGPRLSREALACPERPSAVQRGPRLSRGGPHRTLRTPPGISHSLKRLLTNNILRVICSMHSHIDSSRPSWICRNGRMLCTLGDKPFLITRRERELIVCLLNHSTFCFDFVPYI